MAVIEDEELRAVLLKSYDAQVKKEAEKDPATRVEPKHQFRAWIAGALPPLQEKARAELLGMTRAELQKSSSDYVDNLSGLFCAAAGALSDEEASKSINTFFEALLEG